MVTISQRKFGQTKDGESVTAFELKNSNGVTVTILDFGGTVQSFIVPDADGKPTDIVLGYNDVESYENGTCYYGGIVGRYANRIGNARFILKGKEYQLKNSPGETNHVHGIFHQRIFNARVEGTRLIFNYLSKDMEEGFPGNLEMEVTYTLTEDNALEIDYVATTDSPTVVNLTNHSYFNLDGQGGSTVFDHKVRLNSSHYTEYADSFAQTGKIISVDGTPIDFREEHSIGSRFNDDYYQLRLCTGYDHNMIIDGDPGELNEIGYIKSDTTGIRVDAFTTEPAFQFYSGNYMGYDPVQAGKGGVKYPKNGGLCLEAQHYPDSVNHDNFPNTVLLPGEVYTQKTVYRVSTEKCS